MRPIWYLGFVACLAAGSAAAQTTNPLCISRATTQQVQECEAALRAAGASVNPTQAPLPFTQGSWAAAPALAPSATPPAITVAPGSPVR